MNLGQVEEKRLKVLSIVFFVMGALSGLNLNALIICSFYLS